MNKRVPFRTACLSAVALAAAACSPSGDDAWTDDDGLLRYVPADTPYLLAKVAAPPDGLADKLEGDFEAVLAAYEQAMLEAAAEAGEGDGPPAATFEALADFMNLETVHAAGLTRDTTMAFYGAGMLPVLRLTLSEGHELESTVERILELHGIELTTATIEGASYRYLDLDGGRLVVRIDGREAVLSVVPAGLSEDQLKTVLGVTLPEQSIASSGTLRELADGYGFLPYYAGFLDVDRVAGTLLDEPSGMDAELLELAGYDASELGDTCRAELRAMADLAPRAVSGYTALGADAFEANTVLELREDIAADLVGLGAPVPGLGVSHDALFAYGMGLDLSAAREFLDARVAALESDPYECELFAGMQADMTENRQALDRVPALAYGFRGFLAVVDEMSAPDLATGPVPGDLNARVLIATQNAPALFNMGALFVPELAALNLEPDGEPVAVDVPPQAGLPIQTAYVALTDSAIALGVGDDAEARLAALLGAPASEPGTFLSFEADLARYSELVSQLLAQSGAGAERPPGEPSRESMMRVLSGMNHRSRVDFRFTERGLEMPTAVTLTE